MQTTRVFEKTCEAWVSGPRYISSCGGTRSGKTYSILQLLYLRCLGEEGRNAPPTITSVVSESMPHLKRGAIRDFKRILQTEGTWDESRWSESDKVYKFSNGSVLEFFSIDNAGKVYGSARDYLFINECQHTDYETARQLFVRTRVRIILDYNPTHQFWVQDKIESRPECVRIHSTYKDNGFLSREQVAEIESNRSDKNWFKVFGEGEVGTLDGLIYEFDIVDSFPDDRDKLTEVQGLDFGFSVDPTARVQIFADPRKKEAWVRERCYDTQMLNRDIVADLTADGVQRRTPIYADCAEPKSIAEIKEAGFNIIPCDKSAPVRGERIKFQLLWMLGWRLHITKDSVDLIRELRNYAWEKDRDGNLTGQPIDKFNHLCDAMRYALYSRFGNKANYGQYNISIRNGR